MAESTAQTDRDSALSGVRGRLAGFDGPRLDASVATLILLSGVGLVLDVRSHMGGLDFAEEGFLTPEHSIIYGSVIAAAVLVVAVTVARRAETDDWRTAVPRGYGLGLVGVALFVGGGPGDFVWHSLFGAEANVEALVSPTHLTLATGGVLFGTAPLRSAWLRETTDGRWTFLTVVVPATLALSTVTIFTLYAHPAVVVPGTSNGSVAHALAAVELQALLLAGIALLLVSRFSLPPGSFTFLVGFNAIAMTTLGESTTLAPGFVLAGVVLDVLYRVLRPTLDRPRRLQAFAAAVPAVPTASLFGTLAVVDGPLWSVHLWAGAIFLAAAAGLLASTLVVAPRVR